MRRLLAVKLTNHVKKWASARGFVITGKLTNSMLHDVNKDAFCQGDLTLEGKGKVIELYFDTKPVCRGDGADATVRAWYSSVPEARVFAQEFRLANLAEVLDSIVSELESKTKVANNGLADKKITGLPDLAHNPILATYLCDKANAGTNNWSAYRDTISKLLKVQGVYNSDLHPDHYYADGNSLGAKLYYLLHNEMCGDYVLNHSYYHALIAYHQPLPSETVSGCITYFQDDRKKKAGIRTPIKIRKYLDKFFREAFDESRLCKSKDYIISNVTDILTLTLDLDVRIHDDSDLDGWAKAYASPKISSCMNTHFKNYGVGELETFRCYLTSHFTDGRFSSGLSLAVLYNNDEPVARSIVYEQDGQKYYVRNYADDRLVTWLQLKGYEHSGCIPQGTHLYTEYLDDGGYICPYVDGDSDEGEASARFETIDEYNLWVIDSQGAYTLQTTSGYREVSDDLDDYFFCDYLGRWVRQRDGIYLGDAPDFIQKSWSQYSDGEYVSLAVYERCGRELEYCTDYMIHNTYTIRVLLGDTYTYIADAHYTSIIGTAQGEYVVVPNDTLTDYDADLFHTLLQQSETVTLSHRVSNNVLTL